MPNYKKSDNRTWRGDTSRAGHDPMGDGPATLVSDPMSSGKGSSTLLHPSEGGTRRARPMGEGQTPEGPSWWSQLIDSWNNRPSQPQEEGTGDTQGMGSKPSQLPRYQTPFTTSMP